jgi:hypothetical protein
MRNNLAIFSILAIASVAQASDQAAGVILGATGHVTVEHPAAAARPAALGMRLESDDIVVVDRAATAEIYIKGGGVVRLHDATRFEMPKAASQAKQERLAGGSIAQLENGLWVLNDPKGSMLVSPMRGETGWEGNAVVPLSPRYEALATPSVAFVWSGGPAKARVVVAKRREVVWKSDASAPGGPLDPGAALPLAAGEVYTWWLEPESGGPPLTAGMPFRIADADVLARTTTVEAELRTLYPPDGHAAAADYLRIAHYAGAGDWTRVLKLANRMAPCDARDRALAAATAGLRLDARTAAELASKL